VWFAGMWGAYHLSGVSEFTSFAPARPLGFAGPAQMIGIFDPLANGNEGRRRTQGGFESIFRRCPASQESRCELVFSPSAACTSWSATDRPGEVGGFSMHASMWMMYIC
jgi:hypothetical protein